MRALRKGGVAVTIAAAALALGACAATESAVTGSSDGAGSDNPSVVNVVNGPLGDQGFFDDAARGMELIEDDGSRVLNIQADANNPAQWRANLASVSTGGWDIVICGTGQMVDILEGTAKTYPDQRYIIYDSVVELPNVASIVYKQSEGSFLAGVLAALVTTSKDKFPLATGSKVVGVVGGQDIPVINDFIVGFKKGVEVVDPSVEVKVTFVGSFTDSNKGFDQATLLYRQGADVVYQVAGGSGIGVLKAAASSKRYAIGVDSNQNAIQPGYILASMLKNIGVSLHEAVKAAKAGELKYGSVIESGLDQGGVGLAFENNNDIVPKDIIDKVAAFAEQVVEGKIKVPSTL